MWDSNTAWKLGCCDDDEDDNDNDNNDDGGVISMMTPEDIRTTSDKYLRLIREQI